jgi:UDP-N-acetylmuramoylalanine--D-glutamate ligase
MIDLTRYKETLDGKPVAVLGLGLSGMASVVALRAAGIEVTAWDDREESRNAAATLGAQIENLSLIDLSGFAHLVLAPGIALHFPEPHPAVLRAREAGIEIIGDVEILHRCGHGIKTIGITGTNGKSTTTALIGHILNRCGVDAVTCGNIGRAVLDIDLPKMQSGVIVLELSSYQLDLCASFAPDIAVHMNLTPDHIDRHGDLAGYIAAKMRIFNGAGEAVIGVDDAPSLKMLENVETAQTRRVHPVSSGKVLTHGVYVHHNVLFDAMHGAAVEIGNVHALKTLNGTHNQQNIAAAYAVARLMGLAPQVILKSLETYPGLPHRMFNVRHINGVGYIDDSKATNADAAGKALACHKNIYWIVGGRAKEGGLEGLEPLMDRIAHAFVIGEAADEFCRWLKNHGVAHTRSETLPRAVADSHYQAQGNRGLPGGDGVVLLSPACASFDQFKSFEHRGQVFADLVNALDEGEIAP